MEASTGLASVSVRSEINQEAGETRKFVGRPVKRVEDQRLLTGKDIFLDNIKLPGMVYAGFVRSPYAHARITRIDTSSLEKNAQVVATLTPEEVREKSEPITVIWRVPTSKIFERYALAQGTAKHVGDPVLAVAVRDRCSLEDVLESVEVVYEPSEPLVNPSDADSKRPIHEELGTNTCFELPMSNGNVKKAMEEAHLIVSGTFRVARVAASPMETRGVIADPNGSHGGMTVYSSTQWPHVLRSSLARCLRIPESRLRVIGPDVGGGFGVKGEVYGEEIAIPLLAQKYGYPVKWVETRSESFLSTTHSRAQTLEAQASFTRDGTITGLEVRLLCDLGAYLHTLTAAAPFITAISLNGPYHLPNYLVVAKAVYTNKVPLSAYRGFGQPEAAFVVERLMSMAASKLGIDQAEIRFRNLIQPSEMPYALPGGGVYDSGDYPSCLRRVLESSSYGEMLLRRRETRGQGKLTGVGVSIYTETTGFAPGFVFANLGLTMGGYDSATLRMDPQGKLLVMTGAFPHGQGFNTAVSQICADELGLRLEDIHVFQGDTHSSPYGQGTFGSRTVAVAGTAAVLAARQLAQKILQIGAHLLKKEKVDLSISAGFVISRSEPEKRVPIAQVAASAYIAHDLPQGTEPGLESTVYFNPLGLATSYAAHVCEVEVDTQSGLARVLKYFSVHDCGNQINPMIVEGQIHGGIAQAIGASLLEEVLFNEDGQLLTDSFMSYLLPTAENVPSLLEVDSSTTPTPINPLGAKGIGENGTIIAPPAIANAISDAIGKDVNEIPATPERIWRLIRQDH